MPVLAPDEGLIVPMSLPTNNAFLYTSAPSLSAVGSRQAQVVDEMGKALASARMAQIKDAFGMARAAGLDANQFVYKDQNGQFFTPVLALMARRTQNHMTRALALLKAGPNKGVDLSVQQCWVGCATGGGDCPVLLGMEQAAPAMLALYAHVSSVDGMPTLRLIGAEFFQSLDKWSIDWNTQSETGLTALTEVVRRVPLHLASFVVEQLESRGADPMIEDNLGLTALDYLEERLRLPARKVAQASSAGAALAARWKSLRLSVSLPEVPQAPQHKGPRF